MASWSEVCAAAPGLAAEVQAMFSARKHATMATLRRDGSPRISGTEVAFSGGELTIGSMPGARKALDLRRDPRVALHSPTVDPPEEQPRDWPGEAKVSGRAVETTDPGQTDQGHAFRIDVTEIVVTRVVGPPDQLEVRSWHPGRGEDQVRR